MDITEEQYNWAFRAVLEQLLDCRNRLAEKERQLAAKDRQINELINRRLGLALSEDEVEELLSPLLLLLGPLPPPSASACPDIPFNAAAIEQEEQNV